MKNEDAKKYIDFLTPIALSICGSHVEAADLVQETVLAALTYQSRGKTIENPRAWLKKVLDFKWNDMLRKKYGQPEVFIGDDFDAPESDDFVSDIVRHEEGEEVRREVTYLSESYRRAIVKHYFYGKSVADIAAEENIPVGTVKSRLDFGRKQMKKGLTQMEKYNEQSYMPKKLIVNNSGVSGRNEEPGGLVQDDLLAQNILVAAYEKPLSVSDIAKTLGVAAAYIEPIIKKLVDGELMVKTGDGKIYTDFIIYHVSDYVKYINDAEKFVSDNFDAYITPVKNAIEKLKNTDFYSPRLERYMIIKIADNGTYMGGEKYRSKQVFPLRPNGGQWIAFGTIVPENYKIPPEKQGKYEYSLAGERWTTVHFPSAEKQIFMYNYESALYPYRAEKFDGYGTRLLRDTEIGMATLFYHIKNGIAPEKTDSDTRFIKTIPLLSERGFLKKTESGPEVLVPCLTKAQNDVFRGICHAASIEFANAIAEPLREYSKTHRKNIPPHLHSVPDQKLCLPYAPQPMNFVYDAIERGVHPLDIGYPCPETYCVFD